MILDKSTYRFNTRSILNFSFSIILMAVFLYIAFYDVDFLKVLEISSQANLFWVIVFVLLNFLGHAVRAYRWKFILSSVKPNTKYKNLFNSLLIGYGVNCVTPKLGEVARAIFLARWEGLSRSSMFGTVILERVIDVFFMIISVLIGIYLSTENIQKEFPWLMNAIYFSGLAIILMILLVALSLYFKNAFLTIIEKTLGTFSASLSNNLIYIFKMLIEGLLSLKGWKNQLITFVLSSFIIVIYAITSYVGMFMLGMNKIQNINFLMGWVVMSISALGVIIPTPGSSGSYHTLAKSSLEFIYGFDETLSAAYAFLTHIISYFFMITSAVVIYLLFGRNINKLRNDVNIQTEEKL